MSHQHFLLADADDHARIALAEHMADRLDCVVTEVTSAEAVREALDRGERFDALILETRLPDADGRDLCRYLRDQDLRVPILMLTGATSESDVVIGLDAGANDYIAKPCRPAELLARLRAQLRAFDASEHVEMVIGGQIFRPGTRSLRPIDGGRVTRLTDKEAAVLKFLFRANGDAVTRDQLLQDVWGYSPGTATHTVETHVYRLRRKIEPSASSPRLLVCEAGGYRLCREPLPSPRPMRRAHTPAGRPEYAMAEA